MCRLQLILIGLLVGILLVGCRSKRARSPAVTVGEVLNLAQVKARAEALRSRGDLGKSKLVEVEPGIAVERVAPRGIDWQVKGWGRTQTEAESDAIERATSHLAEFLQHLNPPLVTTPPRSYVNGHFIHGAAQRVPDLDQVIDKGHESIKMECWSLNLVVSPEDYAGLVRLERQLHVEQERSHRMLLSAGILGGMLVLLAGIIALVRLRDWSYSTWTNRTVLIRKRGAKAKALVVACVVILAVVGFLFLA